jgi:putative DNA primase/helicase
VADSNDEFDFEYTLDDTGNGKRLIAYRGQRMRWVPEWSSWITYDDKTGIWEAGDAAAAQVDRWAVAVATHVMDEESERIPAMQFEAIAAFDRWQRNTRKDERIRAMVRRASSAPGMIVPASHLDGGVLGPDGHPVGASLLPVRNGTVNLRTGDLLDFDPEMYWTKRIEIDYDPEATAPTFLGHLEFTLPDDLVLPERERTFDGKELRDWLQIAAGYSLTGMTSEQVFFVCQGPGGTGKSVFLDAIRDATGDFGVVASSETVMVRAPGQHTEDLARLLGRRVVTASELESNRKMSSAIVKNVTGGEPIAARVMRGNTFNFVPSFKLWQGTNVWPSASAEDTGIWRRVVAIPWTRVIQDDEKDLSIEARISREREGILAWMVQGAVEWFKKAGPGAVRSGLRPVPLACREWADEWRLAVNPPERFVRDVFLPAPDPNHFTSNRQIEEVADIWYEEEGLKMPPKNRFGRILSTLGYPSVPSNEGRGRRGIMIDPEWVHKAVARGGGIHR